MAYEYCKAVNGGAGCYVKGFFDQWGPLVYITVALLAALIIARAIRGRGQAPKPSRGPHPSSSTVEASDTPAGARQGFSNEAVFWAIAVAVAAVVLVVAVANI